MGSLVGVVKRSLGNKFEIPTQIQIQVRGMLGWGGRVRTPKRPTNDGALWGVVGFQLKRPLRLSFPRHSWVGV